MIGLPELLWILVFVTFLAAAALAVVGRSAQRRRWGRVAQRRAPVRGRARNPHDNLLDHVQQQLDALLSERQRLQQLVLQGQRLRGMMQTSPQLRGRVPGVDRVLRHLDDRAARLDSLIGKYGQHKDNLRIMSAADDFSRQLEALDAADSPSDALGAFRLATDELDEEVERMLDVSEGEEELNHLLQADSGY